MKNRKLKVIDFQEMGKSRETIEQERLDFQREQQKAYDDYVEWYQTVGCFEDEQQSKICRIKKGKLPIAKKPKMCYDIKRSRATTR